MSWTRSARAIIAFALLVLLHYTLRPLLGWRTPVDFLVIAVLLYGEPFTRAHAIAFGAIWTALALYVLALVRHARASVTLPE